MRSKSAADPRSNERLLLELGGALAEAGAPPHLVESTLQTLAANLGTTGQFFLVPTALFAYLGPLGDQRGGMVRLRPGGMDLGKLADIDACISELHAGSLQPRAALKRIGAINAQPPRWAQWVSLVCFPISSAAATRFFDAGWRTALVAAAVGLVLGTLSLVLSGRRFVHLHVVIGAMLGSALGYALAGLVPGINAEIAVLSGLLYLLPGLTATLAVMELATGNYVSGTSRMMVALIVLFEMVLGVYLGSQLVPLTAGATVGAALPSVPLDLIALTSAALAFGVMFRARPKDLVWIVLASALAFWGSRWGSQALGIHLGAFVGAVAIGVGCNVYARLTDRPALVPLVPGILFMVPGALGFRGINWALSQQTVQAVDAVFNMLMVAVALVTGLLVANVIVSARRDL